MLEFTLNRPSGQMTPTRESSCAGRLSAPVPILPKTILPNTGRLRTGVLAPRAQVQRERLWENGIGGTLNPYQERHLQVALQLLEQVLNDFC